MMGKPGEKKSDKNVVALSVRQLVTFLYRRGGLTRSGFMFERALEGARAHRKLQKERGKDYRSEFALKRRFQVKGLSIILSGRADGLLDPYKERALIEEIKTIWGNKQKAPVELDKAQALIYAALYLHRKVKGQPTLHGESQGEPHASLSGSSIHEPSRTDLGPRGIIGECMWVRMTYLDLYDGTETRFTSCHQAEELQQFLETALDDYADWMNEHFLRVGKRNQSVIEFEFPFPYRAGQREMAAHTFLAFKNHRSLFVMAPTGMGKTLGMLFSGLKTLSRNFGDRMFYVTAKTTGKDGVEKAAEILRNAGACFTTLILTAKQRICLKPDLFCDLQLCPFATGFYDNLQDCLKECTSISCLSRNKIEEMAEKHGVCPYYLSIELIDWVDLVVGDFSHAFDPNVQITRLMEKEGLKTLLLVDEAHNLPSRARAMYSCRCNKREFLEYRRTLAAGMKSGGPEIQAMKAGRSIGKPLWHLNREFLNVSQEMEHRRVSIRRDPELPPSFVAALDGCLVALERDLALESRRNRGIQNEEGGHVELYFRLLEIKKCIEQMDSHYKIIWERSGRNLELHIFCVHPGKKLAEMTSGTLGRVFFSATLHPMEFFKNELGAGSEDPSCIFPSPFPRERLLLLVAPFLSTRMRDRCHTLHRLNELIERAVSVKTGNYLVFFPSFDYLSNSWESLRAKNERWLIQERNASESERKAFLDHFREDPEQTHVGFCVLGGVFAEGVDLLGSRLDGVVIVGVGWPPRSIEADLIQDYYDTQAPGPTREGMNFAYQFPGWVRVLQAAGRVIRSAEDQGFVLLIGDRFASSDYRPLFPNHWLPPDLASDAAEVERKISDFWS